MRFDPELAREVLVAVEDDPRTCGAGPIPIRVPGMTDLEVSYHVRILEEGGLLEGDYEEDDHEGPDGVLFWPCCLTWKGHCFLDYTRDAKRWKETLREVRRHLWGGTPMDMLHDLCRLRVLKLLDLDDCEGDGP